MKPEAESRKEFEAWITGPDQELSIRMFSEIEKGFWKREYTDIRTQLAWEAWQKAREK